MQKKSGKISNQNTVGFIVNFKSPGLFILTIIFLSLLLPLASAAQINLTKNSDSFDKGETLIAKVSANFVEQPTRDNVFFYRDGHTRIPFEYQVANINDDFYIYALLSNKLAGNYSLVLEDVIYMAGAQESTENLAKNFTITENTSDFSVTPGFVNTKNDFSVEVQNLQNEQITITIATPENLLAPSSINVKSGEIKEIIFQNSAQNSAPEIVTLSSANTEYSILVFAGLNATEGSSNSETTNSTSSDEGSFRIEPNRVSVSMPLDSEFKRIIYILNTGEVDIENLTFFVPSSLGQYVTIKSASSVDKNSTERIEITINSDDEERLVDGDITVRAGNLTSLIEISLDFISDYIPPAGEENSTEPLVLTTCAQLNGNICSSNKTCSGEVAKVSDGVCCPAPFVCEEKKKSSTGKIIGWTLVAIVVLFLLWFLKKYKRVRPEVDLLKIGRK
jgi:hypothetical protein